jgi:hypothetical protein
MMANQTLKKWLGLLLIQCPIPIPDFEKEQNNNITQRQSVTKKNRARAQRSGYRY